MNKFNQTLTLKIMKPENLYAENQIDAIEYVECKGEGFYLTCAYHCPCGNQNAYKVTSKSYIIIVCKCAKYALPSKNVKNLYL